MFFSLKFKSISYSYHHPTWEERATHCFFSWREPWTYIIIYLLAFRLWEKKRKKKKGGDVRHKWRHEIFLRKKRKKKKKTPRKKKRKMGPHPYLYSYHYCISLTADFRQRCSQEQNPPPPKKKKKKKGVDKRWRVQVFLLSHVVACHTYDNTDTSKAYPVDGWKSHKYVCVRKLVHLPSKKKKKVLIAKFEERIENRKLEVRSRPILIWA